MSVCRIEGCENPTKALGLCNNHYHQDWMHRAKKGETAPSGKRGHRHYTLWFERKQTNDLVPEWIDFWQFAKDIGDKPGPAFILVRLREGKYGPDNFKWYETLRKRPDESVRQFNARKWQSRRKHFPNFDNERRLKRKYGISIAEYETMHQAQNGLCAICGQPETCMSHHTNGAKRLSVDHNHKTGKVRALLCWRCNGTIGKLEENHNLLYKMVDYLKHHEGAING